MRTTLFSLATAAAIAVFAMQPRTITNTTASTAATINVMELQIQLDNNLPSVETGDLV